MNATCAHVLNVSVQLDHQAITRAIFRGRKIDPDWAGKVLAVVHSLEPVLKPQAVCRWFSVEKVDGGRIELIDPVTQQACALKMGAHASELAAAQRVLCCVGTLGERFDHTLQEWSQSGEVLDGYLADCVGVYGLLQVSRAVYKQLEDAAAGNGWGVGRVLCPGAIEGWGLEEQRDLCALLPLSRIGVALNDSGVLSPGKSVSFVVGIGPGYIASRVDSPCDICTNTGECWCKC